MADEQQLPEPPSDLKPEAQARWRQVIGDLLKRGPVDLETLATYCQVWARWRNAEAGIAKTGDLIKKDRGGVAPNPLIAISNQAGAQARSLEQRLGITRERETSNGDAGGPLSLRAYARRRGVSPESVSKAIKTERLLDSVVYIDGAPKIGDPDLADREWDDHTDPSRKGADVDDAGGSALVKASAEEKQWRAKSAELKFRKDAGELVEAQQLQAEYIDLCTQVRNKLLGLPSRMKQAHPETPQPWLATLDEYVRESLEEIATS